MVIFQNQGEGERESKLIDKPRRSRTAGTTEHVVDENVAGEKSSFVAR